MKETKDVYKMSFGHIIRVVLNKIWIIVLSSLLLAAACFSYTAWLATPKYKASAMMYVNDSAVSYNGSSFSISPNDKNTNKSLVDTYIVILKTRNTLETVANKAGLDYSYEELLDMISAKAIKSTKIFEISVISTSPMEATLIANTIVDVLPDKISSIVAGSSVKTVDYAVVSSQRYTPSIMDWTIAGAILGIILSIIAIILDDIFDNNINSSKDLDVFDLPVLAIIPDKDYDSSLVAKDEVKDDEQA